MGYVQRSAADEDSGGAVLFLLKALLLHHRAEHSIQTERRGWGCVGDYGTCQVNKGYGGTASLHNICKVHSVMLTEMAVMSSVTTTNLDSRPGRTNLDNH